MEPTVLYNVPHEVPWKVYIPLYFYFTGLSAGSFILSSLSTVFGIKKYKPLAFPAAIISFVLLLIAPVCLIVDLQQPFRFWHTLVPSFFNHKAVLSYGTWLLTIYPIANIIYIWFIFVKDDRMMKIMGTITVPLAVSVHAYTGFAFAVVRGRAWWHSALMPGYFLTSAILSGIALLVVVAFIMNIYSKKKLSEDVFSDLYNMMIAIIILDLFWVLSFWFTLLLSSTDGLASIITAIHDPLYLWGELIFGMLLPLFLLIFPVTRRSKVWVTLSAILVIGGVFLMRYSLVFIGFEIPLS
ncbi:MAG: NrfD/PsrC family molybdoenzyme membrane anchor subunit [Thermodesulfobacteriota bacterium]|nr:NrfD/PsrC family molybdoenzyme membrane anchor subunit [Thermodesulfobacteriota bacterium]